MSEIKKWLDSLGHTLNCEDCGTCEAIAEFERQAKRIAELEVDNERLRAALRFYGKDAAWSETVIDSYSGEVVLFDWDGDIADEPWEVAEAALKGADDE